MIHHQAGTQTLFQDLLISMGDMHAAAHPYLPVMKVLQSFLYNNPAINLKIKPQTLYQSSIKSLSSLPFPLPSSFFLSPSPSKCTCLFCIYKLGTYSQQLNPYCMLPQLIYVFRLNKRMLPCLPSPVDCFWLCCLVRWSSQQNITEYMYMEKPWHINGHKDEIMDNSWLAFIHIWIWLIDI